jgi:hypothetical protein
LKATITFTASLGLTNIFGAMIVIHDSIVWHYALALSLGFQGVAIFYFHCWQRLMARGGARKTSSSWGRRTLASTMASRFGLKKTKKCKAKQRRPEKENSSTSETLQRSTDCDTGNLIQSSAIQSSNSEGNNVDFTVCDMRTPNFLHDSFLILAFLFFVCK